MIHPRTIQSGDHMVNLMKAQLEQATKQTYNSNSTKVAYRRCSRVHQRLRHGEYAEPETHEWAENQHTWGTETLRNKFQNSEIRPA
jgi:hypothetical protein